MISSASSPYLVQAFQQIAPTEDPEKDFHLEWKYDLHKIRVGSGYLSSSAFLGKSLNVFQKEEKISKRKFY